VVAAMAGQFAVYAVENVDQAIAILTGLPAGETAANGEFPEGSINHKVAARLNELAQISKSFLRQLEKKPEEKKNSD